MTTSTVGLVAGLLFAIAIAVGGFGGFLLALVLGAAGYLLGGQIDGELDVTEIVRGRRG
ncbi:DUF2273 domain-containing protein [Solicola sp. PLA-1-18]|uniref:DUF2273 domain-containing protein n=1 Tax=Solicola sp. PLA-1-18 TaxID=3380532 RepID=UPI003B7722B7